MTWFSTIGLIIYVIGFVFLIVETKREDKKVKKVKQERNINRRR